MDEIITERSESVLRVQLNRPMKRNAMTSRMYATLTDVFNNAAKDEHARVVLCQHTEGRLTSCGRPCPGVDLRIMDESGRELGPGHRGELVARGANVMRGYWNNLEETELTFRDGMFRTGDVGYRDADGYFFILERVKDMIVTGGENVYCGEVEAVIYEHPAVLEAAVFGMPDPQWGELVAACVADCTLPTIPRQLQNPPPHRVLGNRAAEEW
jgi:acyl-CoA synthetase (AMP-forming)/AMP-acid ligase II